MISYIFFIILLMGAGLCAWGISVTDWRRRIIPDAYLFPLLLIGLAVTHFFTWPVSPGDGIVAAIFGYMLSAIIGYSFEYIQTRHHTPSATPAPIGMGDIKLIAVGGIWLGSVGLSTALIIACIGGLVLGKHKKQKYIPFAPFFICGGILSLITMAFLI